MWFLYFSNVREYTSNTTNCVLSKEGKNILQLELDEDKVPVIKIHLSISCIHCHALYTSVAYYPINFWKIRMREKELN